MEIQCNHHVATFDKNVEDPRLPTKYHLKRDPLNLFAGKYTFCYDYPLSRLVTFEHELTPEMTAGDILALARADYERIYREEDGGKDPGRVPGMLNRERTNGPYGIWGHVISDLYFESIKIDKARQQVDFDIGS